MKNLWTSSPDDLDQPLQDQSWFFFGNVVSPTELSDYGTDEPFWVRSNGSKNLAPPIGNRALASARTSAPSGPGSGADSPVTTVEIDGSSTQAVTFTGTTGTLKRKDAPYSPGSISGLAGADAVDIADISPVTIANGGTAEIDGPSAQSVTFAGTTGTLKLEDPQAFTGLVSGLSGADAIDLSGFAYGANVTATYLGNAVGRHADGDRRRQDGAHRALRQLPVVDLDAVQRREGRHDRRRSDDLRQLAGPSRSAAAAG